MRSNPILASGAAFGPEKLKTPKRRKRFRDPRLRWMDDLLRSFKRPAPDSWLPPQYRPCYEEAVRQDRRKH